MTEVGSQERMREALRVIRDVLEPSPLIPLPLVGIDQPVFAKLETRQPTGSFKVRGALAACAAYGDQGRIVTASAGNHGLGLAYAASRLSLDATVIVPETASPLKVERLRGFDVDLRLIGRDYDEAEAAAIELGAREGRFVSAYNDPAVVAGQGTIADELLEQLGELGDVFDVDGAHRGVTVVAPVGGGGLIAGVSQRLLGVEGWSVVGVETAASRGLSAAVDAGEVVQVDVSATIADGLAGNLEPGSITPAMVGAAGARLAVAEEGEIRAAVRELATDHGLVVEGSGAVGLAALRSGALASFISQLRDKRGAEPAIVLVLTGRNIAPALLAEILGEG